VEVALSPSLYDKFGLGTPVCCDLPNDACPILDSVWPEICAISACLFLDLLLLDSGCVYVPILLLLAGSPGRFGGSKPVLYDAILSCYLRIASKLCAV
jgi:hypothetical protein